MILKRQALEIKQQKLLVVKKQNYEEAANLRDKEKKVLSQLDIEKKRFEQTLLENRKTISEELVYEVVSTMTKIPLTKLNLDDKNTLINLEEELNKSVIGQKEAITKIAKSIRRNRLGIKDPNKPIGSFILLGSTGVGKTLLAKELAKQIFGSDENLIRIDMSEFQEKHTVSRLIGSPPGYVGYDEGGQLTEQVKTKPYSVVLFDEVEKAHKDIFSALLQLLDEGFNRSVTWNLDKIMEKIEDSDNIDSYRKNSEVLEKLSKLKYGDFNEWYEFPPQKTFGEKTPNKFIIKDVDDGKILITYTDYERNEFNKTVKIDYETFLNFLYHPELF